LKPNANLAFSALEKDFGDINRTPSQRSHAAYALVHFDPAHSLALEFLLDAIPTLPKDEGTNLISALARVHLMKPLNVALRKCVGDAKSDSVRNRFLAVELSLGITDKVVAVCELTSDPTSRTSLICGLKDFPGDLASLAGTLNTTQDADLRSALCAAIGTLGVDAAEATQEVLKRLFVEAPDGGTHSAAEWALRQQGLDQDALLVLLHAGRSKSSDPQAQRDWEIHEVNKVTMTMLKIPGREFAMGPVDDEQNPSGNDQIPSAVEPTEQFAAFWLSDREVSVGKFHAVLKRTNDPTDMRNPELPMAYVSRFDAVEFCNELSRADGLQEPYFYVLAEIERDAFRSVIDAKISEAVGKGYRLPTEKEWEYACRAMSTTDHCSGADESLLAEFAVFSRSTSLACGTKPPNGWGLFDMHGNMWEWCWDKPGSDKRKGVLRGGSFNASPKFLRSACCVRNGPSYRSYSAGFRVSRSP
jgi:eukaryotic-like serine/threonine-protein kinase